VCGLRVDIFLPNARAVAIRTRIERRSVDGRRTTRNSDVGSVASGGFIMSPNTSNIVALSSPSAGLVCHCDKIAAIAGWLSHTQ